MPLAKRRHRSARRDDAKVTTTTRREATGEATGGGVFWTRSGGLLSSVSARSVELPRIFHAGERTLWAGSSCEGLKDREAFVIPRLQVIPLTGSSRAGALCAADARLVERKGDNPRSKLEPILMERAAPSMKKNDTNALQGDHRRSGCARMATSSLRRGAERGREVEAKPSRKKKK